VLIICNMDNLLPVILPDLNLQKRLARLVQALADILGILELTGSE